MVIRRKMQYSRGGFAGENIRGVLENDFHGGFCKSAVTRCTTPTSTLCNCLK